MRVALELQPCCGNKTGIGIYTYELAKRLHSHGELTYQGNLFNFLRRHDNSVNLQEISMEISENDLFPYGVYRRIWNLIPIPYSRLFPGADVSVFFNFIVPPNVEGKVITVVHDLTYLRYPETVARRNLIRLRQGMERTFSRSDCLLTVSEFSRREISEVCGIPRNRIKVVYPAASISGVACSMQEMRKSLGINPPYVLFVGTVEPRKNLSRLLAAFDLFKVRTSLPHKLVLCGGRGWNNEDIHRMMNTISCRDEVILTGYQPDTMRNALYQYADAFVFPSVYEGFGVPPLEAMYWDTPVICSSAASLPEVVGDAACLVDPLSEESIAQGLEAVLTDTNYTQQLITAGKDRSKHFTWDDSAKRLEEIIQSLAGVGEPTNAGKTENQRKQISL